MIYLGDKEIGVVVDSIDLSQTTATADDVLEGKEFFNASGEKVTGTYMDMLQWKCDITRDLSALLKNAQIEDVSRLENLDTSEVTTMESMFDGNKLMKAAPQLDTGKVTTMRYMFRECQGLTQVPLYDTSNVTDMQSMFEKCVKLTEVPLFNTSKVTNMRAFLNAVSMTECPLFDTSNVTNMQDMFLDCRKLVTLPLLNTSKNTSMYQMFFRCYALTSIPQLDVGNVTSAFCAFQSCVELIEIPPLNSIKLVNIQSMFNGCTKLKTIHSLDLRKVQPYYSSGVFTGCKNLENLTLKNINNTINFQIGSGDGTGTSHYGYLLTLDSLLNTFKELWTCTSTKKTLTIGTANLAKLENVYVKLIDITDEMRAEDEYINQKAPFVQCESTDEGAMLVTEYVTTVKNWQLA